MAATSAKETPLTPFSRLSPSVYLREPTTTSINNGNPAIIVICFFMDAPPRILVKYVTEYVRLAPSARIIFVLSSASDLLLRPTTASAQRHLTPAVEAIRASADPERPVFFHIFSNGGTLTALRLLVAYRDITGEPMPVSWMIIDSAPGKVTILSSAKALSFTLPRAADPALLWRGHHHRRADSRLARTANHPRAGLGHSGDNGDQRCEALQRAGQCEKEVLYLLRRGRPRPLAGHGGACRRRGGQRMGCRVRGVSWLTARAPYESGSGAVLGDCQEVLEGCQCN